MTELKPCPFCGGEARSVSKYSNNKKWKYFCECWLCSCRTQYFETEEKAIKTWNRRADNG